jgi:hypothetical protein
LRTLLLLGGKRGDWRRICFVRNRSVLGGCLRIPTNGGFLVCVTNRLWCSYCQIEDEKERQEALDKRAEEMQKNVDAGLKPDGRQRAY